MRCHVYVPAALIVSLAVPLLMHAGQDPTGLANPMHYVAFIQQGPRWAEGVPPQDQPGFAEHFAHAQKLLQSGSLVMAGPFRDQLGGGLFIVKASSPVEAESFLTGDPWLKSGITKLESVRPWFVGLSSREAAVEPTYPKFGTERVLSKEVTVRASLEDVWKCWTTPEGIASFFSPESKIELRVDGPYELYMSKAGSDSTGRRGSQGCKVLSYIPGEMLSFEWNFPPAVASLRESDAKTHVVLRFRDLGDGRVHVRFDQLGWQEGPDWDMGYEYFDKAWDWVLNNLKEEFEPQAFKAGVPD